MITKTEMIPLILEVCPSFEGQWREFVEYWRDESEPPLYLALGHVARHLIGMLARGDVSSFPQVFAVVECWHREGNSVRR